MLRLKPSEITLTPADYEETRRRMERRQAAGPPQTLPAKIRGPPVPPGFRARLRHGPDRSRNDAVASLGNIPILRPHRVVHASADDPLEAQIEDSEIDFYDAPTPTLPAEQTPPVPSASPRGPALSLPARTLQLPFRSAPRDGQAGSRLASEATTDDDNPSLPPKPVPEPPAFHRADTQAVEDANERTPESQRPSSTDGLADPADAQDTPRASRVRSILQHNSHAPSPLHQMHTLSSPRQQEGRHDPVYNPHGQAAGEPQTRYLQGYFRSPDRYGLREYQPQTEPRPRTLASARRVRTMSSSSEPSYSVLIQRPDHSESSIEDVFWTTPAPEPPFRTLRQLSEPREDVEADEECRSSEAQVSVRTRSTLQSSHDRYRQFLDSDAAEHVAQDLASLSLDAPGRTSHRFSSEESSHSLPYSLYELPDSRQSSDNHSQAGLLEQAQYDGAGPSRQISHGAYYSIRPSQVRAVNANHLRPPPPPRVPSRSSPDLTVVGQPGVSPLPTAPYSRTQGAQHPRLPSTGLITPHDFVGGNQEATRAVVRDLSSPLDMLEQRAGSYLDRISMGFQQRPSRVPVPSVFQHQVTDFGAPSAHERRASGSESLRQQSGNSAHSRTSAGQRHPDRQMMDQPQRYSERSPTRDWDPQVQRRDVPSVRGGQRSSENMPVGGSSHERPPSRANHAQGPRVSMGRGQYPTTAGAGMRGGDYPAYGRVYNGPSSGANMRASEFPISPVPLRYSIPQTSTPRDMSNRPHMQTSYQYQMLGSSPQDSDLDSEAFSSDTVSPYQYSGRARQAPPPGTIRGPPIPPRYGSRQHDSVTHLVSSRRGSTAGHTPYHFHHSSPPPPFHRQPERALASTSTTLDLASGITSRPPPLGRPPTSRRRLPPRQQDQENSGEAEAELMREELAAVGMRYVEDAQLEVMDETPPRMGRFERHMMNQ